LKRFLAAFTGLLLIAATGCSAPPDPPEAATARARETDLWRAGAPTYAPDEYAAFLAALGRAEDGLRKEKGKFFLLRDFEPVEAGFREAAALGDAALAKIAEEKRRVSAEAESRMALVEEALRRMDSLSSTLNKRRTERRHLIQAELLLSEARGYFGREAYGESLARIEAASKHIEAAGGTLSPLLARYTDPSQLRRWRQDAEETVRESRSSGGYAIIVEKLSRSLVLYKNGRPLRTFRVGLGINGLADKLHAGDNATPEGKYQVVRKLPVSRFHKALLINYPNSEDRRRYSKAKDRGLIPGRRGIGGSVEIHGGGRDSLTQGCVSMENEDMDWLFPLIGAGTPVTIVGAMEPGGPGEIVMPGANESHE